MNEALMRAVIEAVAFFSSVSDDVLDPDIAVEQLERLSGFLKVLAPADRAEFKAYIDRLAHWAT
jgi:hypothetical protein